MPKEQLIEALAAHTFVRHGTFSHRFTRNEAETIVTCYLEGWSPRYVLGNYGIQHAQAAYRLLKNLCSKTS